MLKVENVDLYYGDAQALEDINLHVDEGEIIAIIGANGAGKTSLIKAIAGIHTPSKGSIEFRDKDITRLQSSAICELGVGQVAEGRQIFPSMSVLENLEMGAVIKRARAKEKETLDQVFEMYPILKERQSQAAGTLSGGEQQRVALARAFVGEPDLILADEPTGNLDSETGAAIIDLMFGIRRDLTLMLITHDDQVATRCDRVVRMADGKLEPTALGQTPAADVSLAAS